MDWYGWIELSYNLGALFRGGYERAHGAARVREAQEAEYEVAPRLRALAQELSRRREQARGELRGLQDQLSFIERALRGLQGANLPNAIQLRDSMLLERMVAESERRFLTTLLTTLDKLRSTDDDLQTR